MRLGDLARDAGHALRGYARQPGFTAAALLALAVGIGGCSIIWSAADAVLFRPLDYPEAERLVLVSARNLAKGFPSMSSSPADFADQRSARSLSHLAAFRREKQILLAGKVPERVIVGRVSADLFTTLGVSPALGAGFATGDDHAGGRGIVVLGHEIWQRRFGGDPGILGRSIRLDDKLYTVRGVMPAGFQFPPTAELWRPLALDAAAWADRQGHYLSLVGRLAPGVSPARAQREMDVISARLARQYPDSNEGWSAALESLQDQVTAPLRAAILVLLAAGGLLLAIACGNVANLLLARAASRGREIAVRAALGAGRGRLAGQLLTESVALAVAGGALGLALAALGTRLLARSVPELVPRWKAIGVDLRVALFAFTLALLCGLAAGLAPALRLARADLRQGLSEGGARASLGWRRNRLASLLAVVQIALSFVLLSGAGLLVRSFSHLSRVDPGFDPANVLTFRLEIPRDRYATDAQRVAFFTQAAERLRAIPGVLRAGAISSLPLAGSNDFVAWKVPGRPASDRDFVPFYTVIPGYFETLGVPVPRGRRLDERDRSASPPTVILSAALAASAFPGEDPVGKTILLGSPPQAETCRVAGVAADVRAQDLASPGDAALYGLIDQSPVSAMSFCLRTQSDPLKVVPAVRRVIAGLDPLEPVDAVATMDQVVRDSVADRRLPLLVMMGFATAALALALVGIYGVLSYTVGRATREIGVRVALGARPRDVRRLVLQYGVLMLLPGLLAGVAAALAASRLLASQLFGIAGSDPLTYGLVALLLAAMVLAACLAPARRATRVDPAVTLARE
jgi:putative ABC transport system permease protein